MNRELTENYKTIRDGGGFRQTKRGLIKVSGKEAVQFLNGLITNDVAKFETYTWIPAAFPNAQGRLLAIVRVLRFDDYFIFETEEPTREKVFQNLFRFTFAGDFFVEDLTEEFSSLSLLGKESSKFKYKIPIENEIAGAKFDNKDGFIIQSFRGNGIDIFLPKTSIENFVSELRESNYAEISDELYEILRIENGLPLYGVDMDETTIVPELGIDGLISYSKGCYIGQEIIARIHFRGHIAKQLTGLILEREAKSNDELKSADGKNAGKITSVAFSPNLEKFIALAFVRYDYLAEATELKVGDFMAQVKNLPFVEY